MSVLLLAWASVVTMVTVVAIFRRGRLQASERPSARDRSLRVCLLRPCAGAESGLATRLARGPSIPTRLTVASAADPALPHLRAAAEELRQRGVDASAKAVTARGPNLKVGQLAESELEQDRVDVWIVADSDVDLAGVNLDALVAPIARGEAAATWMAPAEKGGTTFGDRASAAFLNGSLHSFQLLGALDRHGLVGKLFAVDAASLRLVGGFAAFRDHLGEDMALARELRRSGLRCVLVAGRAPAFVSGRRVRDVVERYGRWLSVIRAQRPILLISYPLLFGATLPLVVLAAATGSWAALAVALGGRWAAAALARHWSGDSLKSSMLDVPLGEAVTWAALLRAVASRTVNWRGRRLRLDRMGKLRALEVPHDA